MDWDMAVLPCAVRVGASPRIAARAAAGRPRHPRTGFIALQQQLSAGDALNEYIRHSGSAILACPGGVQPGDFIGRGLFAEP
jgi:hypothetical protein